MKTTYFLIKKYSVKTVTEEEVKQVKNLLEGVAEYHKTVIETHKNMMISGLTSFHLILSVFTVPEDEEEVEERQHYPKADYLNKAYTFKFIDQNYRHFQELRSFEFNLNN